MVHIYPSYSNNEFLLYDFVATQMPYGCSLSPLHFTCSVQASTVTTSLQQLLTMFFVIHVCLYIRATAEDEGEVMAM